MSQQAQTPKTPEEIAAQNKDHQMRMPVFTKHRRTVLLKIYGLLSPPEGVEIKVRDQKAVHQKHKAEAERKDIKLNAYRSVGDTGFPVFGKSRDGRFNVQKHGAIATDFIDQLRQLGLVFTGCHCYRQWGKGGSQDTYTLVLEFNPLICSDDQGNPYREYKLPRVAQLMLTESSFLVTVWANLNLVGENEIRIDTVNLSNAEPLKPGKDQHLHLEGSTYRML